MTEIELTQHIAALSAAEQARGPEGLLSGRRQLRPLHSGRGGWSPRGASSTLVQPYQPEVSQGNLQAMFEYQTLISQLTGMDVSNASLYDGGSAAAEAVLMAMSVTRRDGKVVVAASVHPEYRQILERTWPAEHQVRDDRRRRRHDGPGSSGGGGGRPDRVRPGPASQLFRLPGGCGRSCQDRPRRRCAARPAFDPISLGLLKRPGDLGADIAVAEGQSLGTPMLFGGPYLGIMACREQFVRRMPGRMAGQTVDRRGRRCWVLTLQTREQHIRREKATSNICTNQGLIALRATIYLAALGPQGLRETAELCLQKARYAAEQITAGDRFSSLARPTFKEFVVRDTASDVDE